MAILYGVGRCGGTPEGYGTIYKVSPSGRLPANIHFDLTVGHPVTCNTASYMVHEACRATVAIRLAAIIVRNLGCLLLQTVPSESNVYSRVNVPPPPTD